MKHTRMIGATLALATMFVLSIATPANAAGEGTVVIRPAAFVGGATVTAFVPQDATATSDNKVTFVNADAITHRLHGDDNAAGAHPSISTACFNTGDFGTGQQVTVDLSGCDNMLISYHCDIHPTMRGTIQT